MIQWNKRSPEVANLLNPAFCAVIIYTAIFEYQEKSKSGLPFPLAYLLLPIVLHQETRKKIDSKTNMVVWLQRNPDSLIGFPERTQSLVNFTNEAIEYLLSKNSINITKSTITVNVPLSKEKIKRYASIDSEIADCINKAKHVSRWFYKMYSVANSYAVWGVKP